MILAIHIFSDVTVVKFWSFTSLYANANVVTFNIVFEPSTRSWHLYLLAYLLTCREELFR